MQISNNKRIIVPDWVYDCIDKRKQRLTYWITGGLGSGKTYGSALWHLQRCFENYKSKTSWCLAPTHSKAKLITIPAFIDVFDRVYDMQEGKDYTVNYSSPAIIKIKRTRQEIVFHSANKWQALVGENISHWSATECGYYQNREWYERCMYRMRCMKAATLQGLGESTPEGIHNSFAELANFPEGFDPERNAERIILWTEDNPYLPEGYVEGLTSLLSYDPNKLKSYRYGEFTPFSRGTAYWEFFESRNVIHPVEASQYLPIVLSWDFGNNPISWVAMQRQPVDRDDVRRQRFIALGEGSGKARGVKDATKEFMASFHWDKYRDTPIRIYGGHDGYFESHLAPNCAYDQILTLLRGHYSDVQVMAEKSAPLIKDRLERANELLGFELFLVTNDCTNLIKSLAETTLKDGTWALEKQVGKDYSHFSDAASMGLWQLTRGEDLTLPLQKRIYGINAQL